MVNTLQTEALIIKTNAAAANQDSDARAFKAT